MGTRCGKGDLPSERGRGMGAPRFRARWRQSQFSKTRLFFFLSSWRRLVGLVGSGQIRRYTVEKLVVAHAVVYGMMPFFHGVRQRVT